ncbi:MAG: hypothetical protein RL189_1510 [Pseudomonadota bacterium]|jgi:hypothetical protein
MRKIIAALLIFFLVQNQSIARANTANLDNAFAQMVSEISQGKLSPDEIVGSATQAVRSAKAAGMSEEELVSYISKKLALNMSDEDVQKAIEDMRSDHSPAKISQLAESLRNTPKSTESIVLVIMVSFLLGVLWIGVVFRLFICNLSPTVCPKAD